jgi:hypothetical protein
MSEIVKLQGGLYEFKCPPPPSREEDILFIKEKKVDQFWRPTVIPNLSKLHIRDQVKFIDRERQRFHEGVYAMINGKLTFINNLFYDHLNYMRFDGKQPFYLDHQREDFLFRQLRWESPFCKGSVIAKGRRVGETTCEITEENHRLTEDFYRHVGQISIEQKKTKKSLFEPFINSYVQRPRWLQAAYYKPNGRKPKEELKLSSDDLPPDAVLEIQLDKLYLNGWLMTSPTVVSAFDAFRMDFISADEIWKWKGISPLEFLEAQLPCFEDGGVFKGAISLLSTLGDSKDVQQAVKEGIQIYLNSDPRHLEADGFTKSGLWKYFVSAALAERDLRDRFGKINIAQAEERILKARAKYEEGTIQHTYAVRKKPLTEEEAMSTASGSTTFDNMRLQERIKIITNLPVREKPYTVGKLHPDTNDNKIHFEPTNNGDWLVAIHPKRNRRDNEDRSNRWYKDFDNKLILNKSPEGAVGYDPVRYGDKQTTSNNISKSAIIAAYKFDYFGNVDKTGRSCAGMYAGMYHVRDEDPDAAHYEYLKACMYWGFKGTHERNVDAVYKYLKAMKALDFDQKYNGVHGLWTDNRQKVIKNGVDRFQSLIKRPKVGSGEIDRLKDIPFDDLLLTAKEFDPSNTQKSDLFMANTMMVHGLERINYTDMIDEMLEDLGIDNTLNTLFLK